MLNNCEQKGEALVNDILLSGDAVRKLLGAGNPDAALLYLCVRSDTAPETVGLDGVRLQTATAFLRRVGLIEIPTPRFQQSSEPPAYTEADVTRALSLPDSDFKKLEAETQRRLGKVLSTEDLKILLSIHDYLGLPNEVINILITYCIDRSRGRGSSRRPSFRMIEQEAYRWADEGIDTPEAAAAYVMESAAQNARVLAVSQAMGLSGRVLTQSEQKYILSWFSLGFGVEEIKLAYEKTCVNTGQLKWPYMNSILKSWDAQKLHTVKQIRQFDRPAAKPGKKQADYQQHGEALSPMMRQAVEQMLEGEEED